MGGLDSLGALSERDCVLYIFFKVYHFLIFKGNCFYSYVDFFFLLVSSNDREDWWGENRFDVKSVSKVFIDEKMT